MICFVLSYVFFVSSAWRNIVGEYKVRKTTLVPPRFELGIAGYVAAGVVTVTPRMCLTNEDADSFFFCFFSPSIYFTEQLVRFSNL